MDDGEAISAENRRLANENKEFMDLSADVKEIPKSKDEEEMKEKLYDILYFEEVKVNIIDGECGEKAANG